VQKGIAASVGLFAYPVLQTADILLYQADTVPVGKDQQQHLEMARDIAIKFNAAFGELFVIPEAMIRDEVAVVPGTDGQKMSKSYGNTIPVFASDAVIEKAIMGIVTDSKGASDPKDPDACIIYQIHKLFLNDGERRALADEYRNGLPYGGAKKKLLQTCMDYFAPMRKRRADLEKGGDILEVMIEGAKKAGVVASQTMQKVRKLVGLR
jgi:tryptophanyl-tRNA synthetase